MGPIHLFDLASRQAQWLSVKEAAISSNVANANTPGFKARDVDAFSDVMEKTQLSMAATNPHHLEVDATGITAVQMRQENITEKTHSGNTVNLEQEMMKAGEVNRDFSLNTSIVKAFHRMMLAAVKG
ncbi:flagellar basal body rod protein FlgB [Phyllobacterium phragmitis]|uniref:Flagellar basal body rod protein FlgB n=1 Tax=Phyllobacterium phragmitis TaxID=2670329 RepID=A0A2S9IQ73_9HYPH|nr:flagellar basal body rod protein FlgB [Phyllobacterium phragmitis]PRD42677.1 flagellar basal body rod protein FlgB [Phyllobacterium phragmitis]